MKRLLAPIVLVTASATAFAGKGHDHKAAQDDKIICFPENNLHLMDEVGSAKANIDEALFNEIITEVISYYKPIVQEHGANLTVDRKWGDSTVNAYAQQRGNTWNVAMFGGLARRPEVTPDGFALVVCHEVGHHLGGFPFYGNQEWAASEGQSDYFATQACAKNIWGDEHEKNATFRDAVDPFAKAACDGIYETEEEQNLCYRTSMGGKSLAVLLGTLGGNGNLAFDTPDPAVVQATYVRHPAGQCRLDTYFQGALCNKDFEDSVIPGRGHADGQTSLGAEREAALRSCTEAGFFSTGRRPKCWYSPRLTLKVSNELALTEIYGNGNDVWEPGETFGVNVPLTNNLVETITGAKLAVNANGVSSTSDYPDIPVGETKLAMEPAMVEVPADTACGTRLQIGSVVSVHTWKHESSIDVFLGEKSGLEVGENANRVSIPDNSRAGVTSEIVGVSEGRTHKAKVNVDITHSYSGDVVLTLISPAGAKYILQSREGGGQDDINKEYAVNLNPEAIAGTWKLNVADRARRDVGTLNKWSISFTGTQCNGAIVAGR